jgi:hypothetical protein
MQIHVLDPAVANELAGVTQGVRDRYIASFDSEVRALYRLHTEATRRRGLLSP